MPAHVSKVRLGDVGVHMQLEVVDQDGEPVDLTGATTLEITMSKPDGSLIGPRAADMVVSDPAVTNVMEILSEAGDFDVEGTTWQYEGHVVLISGADVHTRIVGFEVEPILA